MHKLVSVSVGTCIAIVALLQGCRSETVPLPYPITQYTRSSDWSAWQAKTSTLNVWDLPIIAKQIHERLPRIATELEHRSLDFALLQEAWIESDRATLTSLSHLSEKTYFDVARTIGSGLFNLSATPFSRNVFYEFSLNGNVTQAWEGDAYAGKGVGMSTANIRGLPVSIFNTHTIARYGEDGGEFTDPHTLDRLLQLFEIFRAVVEQTDSDAFVIAGDFNFRFFQLEYAFWRKLTSLEGIQAEATDPTFCTYCGDNPFNTKNEGQLDYLFVSPRLKIKNYLRDFDQTFVSQLGQRLHLSDHYGWTATLKVATLSPISPIMVATNTLKSVRFLRDRLEDALHPMSDSIRTSAIEDRICRKCRIEEAIEVLNGYERALEPSLESDSSVIKRL